jgi:hypothetical protein
MLEQLEKDAAIEETDIFMVSEIIMQAIEVKNTTERETTINTREAILDSFSGMLEKMLTINLHLSKQKKVEIIHLLNKLKANKEYMNLLKGNLTADKQAFSDMLAASERLSKKSQSAFEGD